MQCEPGRCCDRRGISRSEAGSGSRSRSGWVCYNGWVFQRDYILRMFEAVAQVAARVLKLLQQQKKPEEAQQVVAEGYRTLSLDREFLLVLDGPSIRTHCGGEDDKLALAARLLLLDCEVQVHKAERREALRTLKAARRVLAELREQPDELKVELERLAQSVAAMT